MANSHFNTSAMNNENVVEMFNKVANLALDFQNKTKIQQQQQLNQMTLKTSQGPQKKDATLLKLGAKSQEKDDSCC